MSVNLGGTFHCTQAFGTPMLDRGGSIVNVVSIAAGAASPGLGAYSPSKAACLALTRQTALEWGPRGVRANAVGPGLVPTPGARDIYDDAQVRAVRAGAVPMRRLGEPADIANVVSFLASDDAGYVKRQRPVLRAIECARSPAAVLQRCCSCGERTVVGASAERSSSRITTGGQSAILRLTCGHACRLGGRSRHGPGRRGRPP